MAAPERRASLLSRMSWLCLLAAVFGGQLVFWQDSTDPFAPVEAFWFKVFLVLGGVPLLVARRDAWLEFCKTWPARLGLAWIVWLWVCAFLTPQDFRSDGLKTALEYTLYLLPFFFGALSSATERKALFWAFLSGSLLAALYAFGQHFGFDFWRWSTDFGGRPLGTIGNPNFFGGHLLVAFGFCATGLLLAAPSLRRRWALALALLVLVLYFTLTVGVWVGMAFGGGTALLFLLSSGGRGTLEAWKLSPAKLGKAALVAIILGALLVASPPGRRKLDDFLAVKSLSVVNRQMMWKVAVKLWRTAPVQGAGLASYRPVYPKLQAEILEAEPKAGWNYVVTWLPHQNYLYWLSETGLIGLGLVLGFWGLCLFSGWRRAQAGEALALGSMVALTSLLGAGFINTFSNIPPTAVASALCLGWLARKPSGFDLEKAEATRNIPVEAWVVTFILALLLGRAGGQELLGNRYTRQGGRVEKLNDFAGASRLYGRAVALDVANFTQQALVGADFSLGENLRKSGSLDGAIEAYRADLKKNPWSPEVHNMLGASLGQYGSMIGRADLVAEGIGHLKTAAWINPGYTTALTNLGGSYATLGNLSGAAQAWSEVLTYDPDNAEVKGYLAGLRKGR